MTTYPKRALPSSGSSKAIAIEDLELQTRCQARSEIRPEIVDEYAALYVSKTKLPPLSVFEVSGKLILVDGLHRFTAAIEAGLPFIRCTVVGKGTIEDAAWYATGVNRDHGIRRTNADKRRAVELAIESEIGRDRSGREIAEHVGVSHVLVQEVKRQLEDSSNCPPNPAESLGAENDGDDPHDDHLGDRHGDREPERVRGRDGKSYRARKACPTATPMPEQGKRYRKAATAVQRVRREVGELVEDQTAETSLRDAWRRLDDLSTAVCDQCSGTGCKWCDSKGWITKQNARATRQKIRSLQISKRARGQA